MFDRIMENSMAIWMLVSLAFPVYLFGTLIKAFRHFRRLRERAEYAPSPLLARLRTESEDWVPSL